MNMGESLRSVALSNDPEALCQFESQMVECLNTDCSSFLSQYLDIFAPEAEMPVEVLIFALNFLRSALRTVILPFRMAIQRAWVEVISVDDASQLEDVLFEVLLSDNHILSPVAADCLSLFISLIGDRAGPFLGRISHEMTRADSMNINFLTNVLSIIREVYRSGWTLNTSMEPTLELLQVHVGFFYAVLEKPLSCEPAITGQVLMCLKALIPMTTKQFAEVDQQVKLLGLLRGLCSQGQELYEEICSLVYTILKTYYGRDDFCLDPYLALTYWGIPAQACRYREAGISMRFWSKVCQFEIDKERQNQQRARLSTRLSLLHWWPEGLIPEIVQPVIWLSQSFASVYIRDTVKALFVNDDSLSRSAYGLLCHLMYYGPFIVFSAISNHLHSIQADDEFTINQCLACLAIICDPHQSRPAIFHFLRDHEEMLSQYIQCENDRLCKSAIVTVTKSIECYGLWLGPDPLVSLVNNLIALVSRSESVANAAISCLRAIVDKLPNSALTIDHMNDLLLGLLDIILHERLDSEVIRSIYRIFTGFAGLCNVDILDSWISCAISSFNGAREAMSNDSDNARNDTIQSCCLCLIADVFKLNHEEMKPKARRIVPLLEELALLVFGGSFPLVEDLLVVLLATVGQLKHEILPMVPWICEFLMEVTKTGNPTVLEPALELMAVLCHLSLDSIPPFIEAIPEIVEASAAGIRSGCLRSLSSLLLASQIEFPDETIQGFLEVCRGACAKVFKIHSNDDDVEGEEEEVNELSEAIINGFTALTIIARDKMDFICEHLSDWTEIAESLVMRQRLPIDPRLLTAYFSLLTYSYEFTLSLPGIIPKLSLLPLTWGITSDDSTIYSRAMRLWDLFSESYRESPKSAPSYS
jgi:hypothetical protein